MGKCKEMWYEECLKGYEGEMKDYIVFSMMLCRFNGIIPLDIDDDLFNKQCEEINERVKLEIIPFIGNIVGNYYGCPNPMDILTENFDKALGSALKERLSNTQI